MTMNQCIPYVNLGVNDCIGFSNVPLSNGSYSIANYLQSINFKKYKFEFINNWTGNTLVDCYNTAQAGQGHNLDYVNVRCDSVAKMFAPIAIATIQNCSSNGGNEINNPMLYVYPNPVADHIFIAAPSHATINEIVIRNVMGQVLENYTFSNNEIKFSSNTTTGLYFIEAQCKQKKYFAKILKR
jgi:hypothetical protein